MNKGRILITGGAGFIGHHLVEHLLKETDYDIVVLDKLNYASTGYDRLRDIEVFDDSRVHVFSADFVNKIPVGLAKEIGDVDFIVHMGAETHVDNSIKDPEPFVMSNVVGTMRMLDFARTQKNLKRFFYFSTDEVFGPAPEGIAYKEWDRYNSTNPYSAAKAGGEELCIAYSNTYGIPVFITHTMNVFGERQHPEKFIPMAIKKILKGDKISIHADTGKSKAGSRFYIHGRNVASAVLFLIEYSSGHHATLVPGIPKCDKFNIVGEREVDNLALVKLIHEIISSSEYAENVPALNSELVDFHSSRPGHDLRYALDGNKMKDLGWPIPINFEQSFKRTVEWTLRNPQWLN